MAEVLDVLRTLIEADTSVAIRGLLAFEAQFERTSRKVQQEADQTDDAIKRSGKATEESTRTAAKGLGDVEAASKRAQAAADQLAAAELRAALATTDTVGKVRLLEQALASTSAGTVRAASLKTQLAGAERQLVAENDRMIAGLQREQQAQDRVAAAELKAALAAENDAGKVRLLTQALAQAEQGTLRYAQLKQQLVTIEQRQTAETNKLVQALRQESVATSQASQAANGQQSGLASLAGTAGQLRGVMAGLGAAFGAQQLISFGINAGRAANSLEKTEATVRALSGSQERYNEVLAIAKQGQAAFGGSLEENLAPLGSLVNLSNRTGTSLENLNNIARRLAIVDPLQGFDGANVALKEFLNGNGADAARSLAARFELPKKAIADLAQEGVSAQQRLAGLNALLNDQGITNEVLASQTNTTAASYDRLGGAVSNAQVAIGAFLAQRFEPAAQGATQAAEAIAGTTSATQGLIGASNAMRDAGAAIFNPVIQGIGAYNSFVIQNGAQLLQHIGVLGEDSLAATDNAAATDIATVSKGNNTAATAANAAAKRDLVDASTQETIAEQLAAAQQQQNVAVGTLLTSILQGQATALDVQAQSALISAIQQDALKTAQDKAAASASASIASYIASGGQLGQLALQALAATDALTALALAQAQTDIGGDRLDRLDEYDPSGNARRNAIARRAQEIINPNRAKIEKQIADASNPAKRAAVPPVVAAQERADVAGQDVGGQLAYYRNKLKGLKVGSTEYLNTLAKIRNLEARQQGQINRDADKVGNAAERADVAGQDTAGQLAFYRNKLKGLKAGSAEYLNTLAKIKALEAKQRGQIGKDADKIGDAQERADLAGRDTAGELAYYRNKLKGLKQGSADYLNTLAKVKDLEAKLKGENARKGQDAARDRDRINDAKLQSELAGKSKADQLAIYQRELARLKVGTEEYYKALAKVRDLEADVANERERAVKARNDAALSEVRDKQDRLKEDRELATIQRVLASSTASAEQKEAARLRQQEIQLEREKRGLEIAEKRRDAGVDAGQSVGAPTPSTAPQPTTARPGTPPPSKPGAPDRRAFAALEDASSRLRAQVEPGRVSLDDGRLRTQVQPGRTFIGTPRRATPTPTITTPTAPPAPAVSMQPRFGIKVYLGGQQLKEQIKVEIIDEQRRAWNVADTSQVGEGL